MRKSNITKAIRFVEKKLPHMDLSLKETYFYLYGNRKTRKDLTKEQDNFVCCFVDDGYCNYYNIDNIIKGKVKAFPGANPYERLLVALSGLYQYCD